MTQHRKVICGETTEMTKRPNKQRSIRFADDLDERLAALAEQEDRTFSALVNRLLRQALAQRSFEQQPSQRQHAAA
jgi:predicted transcriptional regulator